MPSLRSRVFRLVSTFSSARMAAMTSVPELRALLSTGSGRPRLPRGVVLEAARAGEVPVEWIILPGAPPAAASPVVFYLHGGGWVLGWYNSHRWLLAHLSRAAACRGLAVDYRLAPEHPFPAALDDCVSVYRWLLSSGTAPGQIVIAGDSAGGNLTVATILALRDGGDPLPAAGVCLSPMIDLEGTGASFRTNHDVAVTADFALSLARHYAAGHRPRQPLLSPLYADLRGLPPLLIQAGGDEILLSDSTRLAERARAAGVDVRLSVWPKMWHVWQIFTPFMPEARRAVDEVGAFVREKVSAAPAVPAPVPARFSSP